MVWTFFSTWENISFQLEYSINVKCPGIVSIIAKAYMLCITTSVVL